MINERIIYDPLLYCFKVRNNRHYLTLVWCSKHPHTDACDLLVENVSLKSWHTYFQYADNLQFDLV